MDLDTCLLDLPYEILENVATYLDGESLFALSKVCRSLRALTYNPGKELMQVWKKVSHSEIPPDYLTEILQSLYPKHWMYNDDINWQIIYQNWKLCSLADCIPFANTIHNEGFTITALFVSGVWLLVVTRQRGCLFAIHLVTKEKKLLYKGADVLDMQVYCTTPPLVYTDNSGNVLRDDHDGILPDVGHDEVLLYLEIQCDIKIDLRCGATKMVPRSNGLYQLRRFEEKELSVYQGQLNCTVRLVDNKVSREKIFPGMPFWQIIDMWKNQIILMNWTGEVLILDGSLNAVPHPLNNSLLEPSIVCHTTQTLDIKVYHWHGKVGVQISGKFGLHELRVFHKSKCVSLWPFHKLGMHVLSMLYCARILVIGTDIGSILVYSVNSDEDLLSLDLDNYTNKVDLSDNPITCLAVKLFEKETARIFASSKHHVYEVEFKDQVIEHFQG